MDTTTQNYQYYKNIFSSTKRPFAFVDLDFFDENIKQIKNRAGGKKIRIASKSVRCVNLLKRILEKDKQYQGIMAFHADEAVFLSQYGFDDILVAYPVWNENQIEAVAQEVKKGKYINLILDCKEHVERINTIGKKLDVKIPISLDIDMSSSYPGIHFGVFRSQLNNVSTSATLARFIEKFDFVALDGIMGYEAQIAGVGDNVKGAFMMNSIISALKKNSIIEIKKRRGGVVEKLPPLRFVNAGGSGSLESSRTEDWVTEVTVGSGFYSPGLFDNYKQFKHLPAAAFAIEICRKPKPNMYTCLGGGYVASGAVGIDKQPKPYLPHGVELTKNEGTGEVQTPINYKGSEQIDLGDPIFFRHSKAGELCERFNELYLVKNGKIVDTVPTYRGEGQCFM